MPVATGIPSLVHAAKSIILEFRPTSAMSLSFGSLSSRARKFDPFANRNDDVGITKALDEVVKFARRLTMTYDIVMADQRKTFKLIDYILIVIGNNDFHPAGSPLLH